MGPRVGLIVSILHFHLTSWVFAGTTVFYHVPERSEPEISMEEISSHFPISPPEKPLDIMAMGRQQLNPPEEDEDLEYDDDEENEEDYSEEDDEDGEDEANKKPEIKKKKTKFEKINDFKEKIANKYLDKFLQIKTKEPPDLPEEAVIKVWGVPPMIEESSWHRMSF